jgi:hypothetical protein
MAAYDDLHSAPAAPGQPESIEKSHQSPSTALYRYAGTIDTSKIPARNYSYFSLVPTKSSGQSAKQPLHSTGWGVVRQCFGHFPLGRIASEKNRSGTELGHHLGIDEANAANVIDFL